MGLSAIIFHFSRGTAFNGLYKLYSYLKSIGFELTIDDFLFKASLFSDTQGGGKTLFEKTKKQAKNIHDLIPVNGTYHKNTSPFYKMLEKDGVLKQFSLHSLTGEKLSKYTNFDQFFAHWLFYKKFRNSV